MPVLLCVLLQFDSHCIFANRGSRFGGQFGHGDSAMLSACKSHVAPNVVSWLELFWWYHLLVRGELTLLTDWTCRMAGWSVHYLSSLEICSDLNIWICLATLCLGPCQWTFSRDFRLSRHWRFLLACRSVIGKELVDWADSFGTWASFGLFGASFIGRE